MTVVFACHQISEELIRVAILWHELWHEGLEEASRLYFGERNVKGMFAVLEPLHQMMEAGPQTLKETSFQQVCFDKYFIEYTQYLFTQNFMATVLMIGGHSTDLNVQFFCYTD